MPSFFLESLRPNRGEVGWAAMSLSSAACICVLEVYLYAASSCGCGVVVFLGLGLVAGPGGLRCVVVPCGRFVLFERKRIVSMERASSRRGSEAPRLFRRDSSKLGLQGAPSRRSACKADEISRVGAAQSLNSLHTATSWALDVWGAAHERPRTFDECGVVKGSSGREESERDQDGEGSGSERE